MAKASLELPVLLFPLSLCWTGLHHDSCFQAKTMNKQKPKTFFKKIPTVCLCAASLVSSSRVKDTPKQVIIVNLKKTAFTTEASLWLL